MTVKYPPWVPVWQEGYEEVVSSPAPETPASCGSPVGGEARSRTGHEETPRGWVGLWEGDGRSSRALAHNFYLLTHDGAIPACGECSRRDPVTSKTGVLFIFR